MSNLPLANVSSGQSSSAFSQQGSLDWVALGRMQYSASIAVLGRLAKAGIDPLTVAFGQAMCLRLPIGAHGERMLAESMSTLTVKSSAGDLIWFGVGVRHILRELVQTSQGCSLVALSAALTESYTIPVSALVLYQIVKECEGPQELAPSLEQWEALVRVAAPVFKATTFGLRIQQIAKFGVPVKGQIRKDLETAHPSDLARVLLKIGQIVHGNLQAISIQGDCCCSWIVAWVDFVLGLRVCVHDPDGAVVYANYDPRATFPQVTVQFIIGKTKNELIRVESSSYLIRSGREFIQQSFGRVIMSGMAASDYIFGPGRVHRDNMLSSAFGDAFSSLTSPMALKPLMVSAREPATALQLFTRILASSAMIVVARVVTAMHYGSATRYLLRACEAIPELHKCRDRFRAEVRAIIQSSCPEESLLDSPTNMQGLIDIYRDTMENLARQCICFGHLATGPMYTVDVVPTQFCLPRLAQTIVSLVFLLDLVVLDTNISPTVSGLHLLYDMARVPLKGEYSSPDVFLNDITGSLRGNSSFSPIAAIFSGNRWDVEPSTVIAQSNGSLYCYIHLIEELTDNLQMACKIHVGPGSIECRAQHYKKLYDTSGLLESQPAYPASHTGTVDNIKHFEYDSTSSPIESQAVLEERPACLYFRYQISSPWGRVLIPPSRLLDALKSALSYKCSKRQSIAERESWNPVLWGYRYALVHGEGLVDISDKCHMLRPLRGNILGRCVAMALTKAPMALIKTEEDLELFARFWARRRDLRAEIEERARYYTLIS